MLDHGRGESSAVVVDGDHVSRVRQHQQAPLLGPDPVVNLPRVRGVGSGRSCGALDLGPGAALVVVATKRKP